MQVLSQIIPGQVVEGRKYPDVLYITGYLEKNEIGSDYSCEISNKMRKLLPERFNHLKDDLLVDYRSVNGRLQINWIVPNYNRYR